MTRKSGAMVAALVAALYSGVAAAAYQLHFTRGATPLSEEVYDLRILMMWTVTLIFFVVFGVIVYAVYKHRKSAGRKAENFHQNTSVEIAWTVVPFFILLAMTVPATKALLEVRDASSADLAVKITAYPWTRAHERSKSKEEGVALLANSSAADVHILSSELKGESSKNPIDRFEALK